MLTVPSFVWNWQGSGYVCLSSNNPAVNGSWEDRFFPWPSDKRDMLEYIKQAQKAERDVYWAVAVYQSESRVRENIDKIKVLWADLDSEKGCLPLKQINPQPSIVWKTSDNNRHAVWLLDTPLDVEKFDEVNKELTYKIKADKGTWNASRVLRVPGSINYKRGGEQGKLLYAKKVVHSIHSFIHTPEIVGEVEEEVSENITSLLYPYRKKITARAWELINTPASEATQDKDRSARLWQLQRLLEEARVPKETVRKVLDLSVWNKFADRHDRELRLDAQLEKTQDDIVIEATEKKWTTYTELMGRKINRPEWLIEGWWQKNSHGIIAGEPKTFKSFISTDIAVSVASGRPLFGTFPVKHTGPVLIVQEENDSYTVQDRLRKVANNKKILEGKAKIIRNQLEFQRPPTLPIYFLNTQQFSFAEDEDRMMLEQQVKEMKPALVIFDPVYLMLGGLDENSAKDIRPILNWLLRLSDEYSTAVMLIHHWNKAGISKRGGQRMYGSTMWHAWVESAMYVKLKDKTTVEIEREFRSFAKPGRCRISFDIGEAGQTFYRANIEEENQVVERLRGLLKSQGQATPIELKQVSGLTPRKLLSILEYLKKSGEVEYIKGKQGGQKEMWKWCGD